MTRHRNILLLGLLAVASLAIGVGARLLTEAEPATGQVSFRLARPVDRDPVAEQRLVTQLDSQASKCTPNPRTDVAAAGTAVLDAIAAITCVPRGLPNGKVSLYRFRKISTIDKLMDGYAVGRAVHGGCDGGGGQTSWATRNGEFRGRMLCISVDGAPQIVWTDGATRTLGVVGGTSDESLPAYAAWWQRTNRPETADQEEQTDALVRLIHKVVPEAGCEIDTNISPLGSASVNCTLPRSDFKNSSMLSVERVPTKELVERRIEDEGPLMTAGIDVNSSCDTSLARSPWYRSKKVYGTLICYPTSNDAHEAIESYRWSYTNRRIVLAFDELNGDEAHGVKLWEKLAYIGGP